MMRSRIRLIHWNAAEAAASGFEETLGTLPAGAQLQRGRPGLTIWRSQRDLHRRLRTMVPLAERGALWILWPKQRSGVSARGSPRT